mmetsp:Transcript_39572/g.86368  ORF Transcript_39572/g.86368 Transcript_39572/m.86368 type:complete len:242 (-) Transcript_39572:307-1032(-)
MVYPRPKPAAQKPTVGPTYTCGRCCQSDCKARTVPSSPTSKTDGNRLRKRKKPRTWPSTSSVRLPSITVLTRYLHIVSQGTGPSCLFRNSLTCSHSMRSPSTMSSGVPLSAKSASSPGITSVGCSGYRSCRSRINSTASLISHWRPTVSPRSRSTASLPSAAISEAACRANQEEEASISTPASTRTSSILSRSLRSTSGSSAGSDISVAEAAAAAAWGAGSSGWAGVSVASCALSAVAASA